MSKEFTMLEGFEGGDKEIELSLELSIGGSYRRTEKPKQVEEKPRGPNDLGSRSDFSCDLRKENGLEFVDLNRKREIQAWRRQEARKKREEKLKKFMGSRGLINSAEDKLWLEAQQLQTRVGDREIKENESFLEEAIRKKGKNGGNSVIETSKDLNLSLKNGVYQQLQYVPAANGFGYRGRGTTAVKGEVEKCNAVHPGAYSNGNSSMHSDSGRSDGKGASEGSLERSSAVLDYQSIIQKGGSINNSDTGSNSSTAHMLEQPESNVSSVRTEAKDGSLRTRTAPSSIPQSSPVQSTGVFKSNQTTKAPSTQLDNQNSSSSKESNGITISKPPKPQNQIQKAASLSHMPCVSTTGNGPNGKTITGFLYKYTKSEVSIMCVCHGTSFSPAEFVEHAGGVDISHPLRHITVVPSAFG